jgi:hypothetical protein
MQESKYFYLWQHRMVLPDDRIVTRTCFGITGNLDNRRNNYEGHVGHEIEFSHVWAGLDRPIRELEIKIKSAFADYLVKGFRDFTYEWINEEVAYEQILGWVEYEVEDQPSIDKFNLENAHGPKTIEEVRQGQT